MNIDIERLKTDLDYWLSVAPEGATHYGEQFPCPWLREEPASYFREGQWVIYRTVYRGKEQISESIPRPTWNGEGLPPIGVECEGDADTRPGDYEPCIPIYHDSTAGELQHTTVALFQNSHGNFTNPEWCTDFRPLKTEKERVVEAAMQTSRLVLYPGATPERMLEALYDAGYLKMPGGE